MHSPRVEGAIGLFDSGIGGLTVMRELMRLMPCERILYFADRKRLPYGEKEPDEIAFWTERAARFLIDRGIKLLVLACHTATAYALPALQKKLPVPVLGIIEPGLKLLAAAPHGQRIAVLGTPRLIQSEIYANNLPQHCIHGIACPLFAPLVERGCFDGEEALAAANIHLSSLKAQRIDALFLACTHYPLLLPAIRQAAGSEIPILDPTPAAARDIRDFLAASHLLTSQTSPADHAWFTTADPDRLRTAGVFPSQIPISFAVLE